MECMAMNDKIEWEYRVDDHADLGPYRDFAIAHWAAYATESALFRRALPDGERERVIDDAP